MGRGDDPAPALAHRRRQRADQASRPLARPRGQAPRHERPGGTAPNAPRRSAWAFGDPEVLARGGVRKIAVPRDARELCTLPHVDFEDAYLVDVDPPERTTEQWARAIFEEAPLNPRLRLWAAWVTLGLRLALPTSHRHVLGWEIRHNKPGAVLLGARSRVGMPAELLVKRHDGALLFDTFVQHSNPVARAAWAAAEPAHARILPALPDSSAGDKKRDAVSMPRPRTPATVARDCS